MRNSPEAEIGGGWWSFSQVSVQQGGGAQRELWVLGSCSHFIPEPQLQTHVVAILWEVLIQRLSFPPENLSPGWDQGNRPSWSHGGSPQPLTTAGSYQSRFTSQGGAERNRGSSSSLCHPCVWSKRARLSCLRLLARWLSAELCSAGGPFSGRTVVPGPLSLVRWEVCRH